MTRSKLTMAVIALFAVVTLLALPLAVHATNAEDAAAPAQVVEQVETPAQVADSTEATPAPADFDLEAIMDDTRQEMACNPKGCDASCKAQYGQNARGTCGADGLCRCAL